MNVMMTGRVTIHFVLIAALALATPAWCCCSVRAMAQFPDRVEAWWNTAEPGSRQDPPTCCAAKASCSTNPGETPGGGVPHEHHDQHDCDCEEAGDQAVLSAQPAVAADRVRAFTPAGPTPQTQSAGSASTQSASMTPRDGPPVVRHWTLVAHRTLLLL